jgi:acyl-homoserine-lactone acylase
MILTARRRSPVLFTAAVAMLLASCAFFSAPPPAPAPIEQPPQPMEAATVDPRVELLWDEWGVPHIFADDAAALFYASGWAMMHSHTDLVLRLYGQARGRAAEYWGERYVDSDVWVRTNGIPARAERWLDEQAPHARAYIESFIAGMNSYVELNPESVSPEMLQVLPLTATDVLAHQQRLLNFTLIANPAQVTGTARIWQAQPGSNAWAVSPQRSASGNALLLLNPHLPWGDMFTFYEVHFVTPEMNFYGAALVGLPGAAMGFNEHLGWAHTVNTIDAADMYELTVQGDTYFLDGVSYEFETVVDTIRVLQPDLSYIPRVHTIRRSVHGPVFAQRDGRALALRVTGLDSPNVLAQYLDMMRANNRASFEIALSRLQMPLFTVMYADRDGDIMHVFNGAVPVRGRGDWAYWQGIVSGDSSSTLWTRTHEYSGLPRVVNPPSGWLQNANDPPWTTTFPTALNPVFFPAYMAPQRPLTFRALRSARMLAETPRMSLEHMIELKHSTRMQVADHLVSDVVAAARALRLPGAVEAADVLEAWDRTADATSRGALLFSYFYRAMTRQRWPTGSMFELSWTPTAPFSTPNGLADPRRAVEVLVQAATQVRATYGALDVPWGDVHRFRRDDVDLPANGGDGDIGIFRVVDFARLPGDSTRSVAVGGDSFVAAVEFSSPLRARVLTVYGNSSQRGSPHRTDQLPLFARKELRPVRMTRQEVLPFVVKREAF